MRILDGKLSDYREKMIAVEKEISQAIIGVKDVVELVNLAIFSRGHILLDGLPGVAKTTLCMAIARVLGGDMVKFEGRPDFMPNQFLYVVEPDENGNPKFHEGPLFTKKQNLAVTLIDEITRFTPHAQAFWFEPMNEFRLTLATQTLEFPHNRVLATKNKVTRGETWDIPQPQLDRFLINVEMGYPDAAAQLRIITDEAFDNPGVLVRRIRQVIDLEELEEIVDAIQPNIYMSGHMAQYLFDAVQATRYPSRYGIKMEGVEDIDALVDPKVNAAGVSPRGAAKWRRIAKVAAFRRGSDHLSPDDAIQTAPSTLAHRIFINERAPVKRNRSTLARDFLKAVLSKIEAPQAEVLDYAKRAA